MRNKDVSGGGQISGMPMSMLMSMLMLRFQILEIRNIIEVIKLEWTHLALWTKL